ncbi:MAG TPA: peptide deformylase [Alphaproteobacteria bacterium]|nr:peptide deformylase [Alphaproteobacteria bacterium]
MPVLDILVYPDPKLKKVSEEVKPQEIKSLQPFMDDMLETMYANKGLGLAAVQVGVLKRILIMDIAQGSIRYDGTHNPDAKPDPLFLINPEIVEESAKMFCFEEGCLSFPAQFAEVKRPEVVTVKFLDYQAKEKQMTFEKLASVCVQHEIDHLNGIVFVEHISKMKRDLIAKKLEKYKKRLAF